jgi:hypothetical protein
MNYQATWTSGVCACQLLPPGHNGVYSLAWPGVMGLVVGGPVGLAAGATVGGIVAYEFERKVWKHVQETVKKVSQVQPTLESVDTYHH